MRINRRTLFKTMGSIPVVSVTGCLSSMGSGSSTNSTASKGSRTKANKSRINTTSGPDSLSYTASIAEQQTSKSPARVKAVLENTGSEPIQVFLGPTLMFSDDSADLAWSNEIILDPEKSGVETPGEKQKRDGCWMYALNSEQIIQSLLQPKTIEPDSSIAETYKLYTKKGLGKCLPEGTYRYEDEISVGDESRSVLTSLILHINNNQKLSADATLEK